MNNEFHFNIPIDPPKPKNSIASTIKSAQKHIDKAIHQQRKDWPEYMVLKVFNIYSDNTFDLITPDEEHLFERVSAIDPRAKDFYQRGKAVTVRFNNVNGGRPYIKFGYGFMSTPVDITPQPSPTIRFWTQSKASWLQNQHAPEACQLYSPWDSSGTDIYTFYSKEGDTFLGDPRGRPYGLVAYRDAGDNPRLAVAYMVFSSDGSYTKYHKIDVIDLNGSLIHQYSFDSTAVYAIGNLASYGQFSINPTNLHFTLIPQFGTENVLLRAWETSGVYHTLNNTMSRPSTLTAFAHDNILYADYSINYSGGGASIVPHVWPLTPTPESSTTLAPITGYKRNSDEVLIQAFNLDPSVLCTTSPINRHIVSGSFAESLPPSDLYGNSWYLTSLENKVIGSTIASDASWASFRNSYSNTRPSSFTLSGDIILSSKLNITKISATDGTKMWVYSITDIPKTVVILENILASYETYIQDVLVPGYRGWSGRTPENSRNELSLASFDNIIWPSSDLDYPPTLHFSWPRYDYLPFGITLMPQLDNNIRSIRAASVSTPYYTGQINSLISITNYMSNNIVYGNHNSLYVSPNGDIIFTYIISYPYLNCGRIINDLPEDPYLTGSYNVYIGHMPTIEFSFTTTQVCLTPEGTKKWSRDLTQWGVYETWFTTADFNIVGGNSGISLPVPNNVKLQIPTSKYLLVARELRGLGPAYRPDLWLEVVNIENGSTIQFIYLPLSYDTLTTDIDDGDGTPIANAGERNYAVSDIKIKTATTHSGVDWCVVWTKHYTRDGTTIPSSEDHIDLYMAPTDGSIGVWSAVGSWTPNYAGGDHAPTQNFFDTLCVSDGSMHWVEGNFFGPDFKWQVYKRDL